MEKNWLTIRKTLAKQFISRAEAQGLKGKARDRAAIEFFVGASALAVAEHGGNSKAWGAVSSWAFLVSFRGYAEVEALARDPEPEAPKSPSLPVVKTIGQMEKDGEIPPAIS
jgi:hypothetical protein